MKKILILFTCVVICLCAVACAVEKTTLEGTYSDVQIGTGVTMTFEGDGITLTYSSAGNEVYTVSGTYEIEDDTIIIEFTGEDLQKAYIFAGTKSFEMRDGYIYIDGIRYKKQ